MGLDDINRNKMQTAVLIVALSATLGLSLRAETMKTDFNVQMESSESIYHKESMRNAIRFADRPVLLPLLIALQVGDAFSPFSESFIAKTENYFHNTTTFGVSANFSETANIKAQACVIQKRGNRTLINTCDNTSS